MKHKIIALAALVFVCLNVPALAADGKVIASIKPLHSLVAAVMAGDDNAPLLLVDGKGSLHSFMLKPSQMQSIQNADIVFYMGDSFEAFLDQVLDASPATIERVPMEKIPGMALYPVRLGQGFEPHVHEGEGEAHHHHDEGAFDLHLWTSPANAKRMVTEITKRLSEKYPQKKSLYQANAKALQTKLDALDKTLRAELTPLKNKPFVVFHDAYQYMEKEYSLDTVGSITMHPERAPTAKHVSVIRDKIRSTNAACVFREPQFDAQIVDNLIEGTKAKSGMLDPEGALLSPGPELYFQLMQNLAKGLAQCLQ